MNKYKVVFAAVIFTFVNGLQANTGDSDLEYTIPFKKTKTIDVCCAIGVNDIHFIEVEQEIDLGFNPYDYLPTDFNPYTGIELAIDDINYIEEEVEIDLGFDVQRYLPKNFDAHQCIVK